MKRRIESYRTLIFDCDGVVFDSNQVKSEAFYHTLLPYGEASARAFVNWHIDNGGISRYAKFQYFLSEFVSGRTETELSWLLERFSSEVRAGLLSCSVAPGLAELRVAVPAARWLIVSGGDQAELREVFDLRGLAAMFDGGIFGSPDSKEKILERELSLGNIRRPAVLLGDSTYDHRAAMAVGLDFIFVSGWSELPEWQRYVIDNDLRAIEKISGLLAFDPDGC